MKRHVVAATVVAVAAVLPRILIVLATTDSTVFADMVDYYDRARYLHDHGALYPTAFRVPLYPISISGSFILFGQSPVAPRILQCAIFALLSVATYALASRMMSITRAMCAAVIVAWYPGLLLYTVYVVSEPLFMLLTLLAVLAAQHATTLRWMMTAGILAGLATLTRQAGVAVSAALVSWAAFRAAGTWRWHGDAWRRASLSAAVALGIALAMSPWIIRNYVMFGRWMPLETTAGITFLMAHYEGATGRYFVSDWQTVHERYLDQAPDEFARNAEAYRLGLEYIKRDPWRILALVPWRVGYLLDIEGREHLWLYTNGYFGPRSPALVKGFAWVIAAAFPLLVTATVINVTFGPPLQSHSQILIGWVLAVMIVQLLTIYGDPRFHLPLVPFLAILAVRPWTASPSKSSLGRAIGVMVLIAVVLWWGSRVPGQLRAIADAAAPNGWQSPKPY
jgi:4-amino-4-deoxy-L-arabinose transferase-like glycosyltransferase